MKISALSYLVGLSFGCCSSVSPLRAGRRSARVSSRSRQAIEGLIHAYKLDLKQGSLTLVNRTIGVSNPFFLALSPDRKFMYSIHAEKFGGKEPEHVAAFEVMGRTGQLRPLNRQSSCGTASCYLHVDATGKTVVVANYSSGNIASLPVNADGSLGESASFSTPVQASIRSDKWNRTPIRSS